MTPKDPHNTPLAYPQVRPNAREEGVTHNLCFCVPLAGRGGGGSSKQKTKTTERQLTVTDSLSPCTQEIIRRSGEPLTPT